MHFFEAGLAFVEGLALIASPCILPVLPLVLSASVDGGRRRPFGIIAGFVIAFSLFALVSRKLVSVFHVDLDIIKYTSLALLLGFGCVLLSSKLSEKFSAFTQGAASFGSTLAGRSGDGFISGMGIGALIGLVWTPCAGPILAAVLVQVIRQQSDATGSLMIFSFALGAGVPMLIIALAGRKIMSRLGFFTTHSEGLRKAFGLIIIASVAFIASGADVGTLLNDNAPNQQANAAFMLEDGLATAYPAPEFAGIDAWINSPPLSMRSLRGKVVLVDFWTYSCINCLRTLPYIKAWNEKYHDKGLAIIGVHAPEFEFEKNPANVKAAVAQHGITYPVALDSELVTWAHFKNQYWPAHYLIDPNGNVVYTHFGEGKYDVTENNIRYLLGIKDTLQAQTPSLLSKSAAITPETYLGYKRMARFAGGQPAADTEASYRLPATLPVNAWALGGRWKIEGQKIVAGEAGARLQLHFKAKKVFLVLGTAANKPVDISLTLNGKAISPNTLTVDMHKLYELADQKTVREGELKITASEPGLEAYAFTFGG